MTEAEIQFIEDPEIAAAIGELKSRWPAIGEAADHPLTEFFFLRRKTAFESWRRRNRLMPFVLNLPWTKQRDIQFPLQLFYDVGDKSIKEQLWMTPLKYRDLCGIDIGFGYCGRRRLKLGWIFAGLAAGFNAIFLIVTAFADPVLFGKIAGLGREAALPAGSLTLCALTFTAIMRLDNCRACVIATTLMQFQTMFYGRSGRYFKAKGAILTWPFWFLAFGSMMYTLCALITAFTLHWVELCGCSIVWIFLFTYARHRFSSLDLDREFVKLVEVVGPQYEEVVRKQIGAR